MTTPITTIDEFKNYAGISSNNQDLVIGEILGSVSLAFESFCGRIFQYDTITEYRDGNNSPRMQLAHYPVVNFTSITIDDRLIPESVNGNPGYKWVRGSRTVILVGYRFTAGLRNTVFNFTAGFGDGLGAGGKDLMPWPADVKLASHMYILTRLKERERMGVGSRSLAGESVTYDATSGTSAGSEGMPSAARSILEGYYNRVPESGL